MPQEKSEADRPSPKFRELLEKLLEKLQESQGASPVEIITVELVAGQCRYRFEYSDDSQGELLRHWTDGR